LSRMLSLYRYIATTPGHHLHRRTTEGSLLDFVSSQVEGVENGQTRLIAGELDDPADASTLVRAKENLAGFSAVGVMEQFDESMLVFKRRLGWKLPFYVRENVTRALPIEVTREVREVMLSRNELDLELYQFGRLLFEDHVRREGPLFQAEVTAFRT